MAKRIQVANGYEIEFDQRARGQETPYYVGRIFRGTEQVGIFQNSGTGGATIISSIVKGVNVVADFEKMVDDEARKQGVDTSKGTERESEVIDFANKVGYAKGLAGIPFPELWPEWVKQMIAERKKYGMPFPKIGSKS